MTTWRGLALCGVCEQSDNVPILQKTRAIWSTKLNSVRPEISLVPCAVWSVFDLSCEKSNARLGSS